MQDAGREKMAELEDPPKWVPTRESRYIRSMQAKGGRIVNLINKIGLAVGIKIVELRIRKIK